MYENHRDSFTRPDDDHRSEEPAARWRRGEDRYRREAQGYRAGDDRFDDDHDRGRNRERDYGPTYRDDALGARAGSARYAGAREPRGYDAHRENAPSTHWHERDHDRRAGYPFSGTYGGTGDSSYFTGDQGSWAVAPSDRPQQGYGFAGQNYGADYRTHGYGRSDDHRGFWDRATDEVASWFGDEGAARRRDEDHRGRGPKNYTRSDERIRDDANDRLTDDPLVDASDVTVTVKDGEVTLDGTVHSRLAKRRAEDCVEVVSGVGHVQNNLRVKERNPADHAGSWQRDAGSAPEVGTANQAAASKTAI